MIIYIFNKKYGRGTFPFHLVI
jgi:hypothetical protein